VKRLLVVLIFAFIASAISLYFLEKLTLARKNNVERPLPITVHNANGLGEVILGATASVIQFNSVRVHVRYDGDGEFLVKHEDPLGADLRISIKSGDVGKLIPLHPNNTGTQIRGASLIALGIGIRIKIESGPETSICTAAVGEVPNSIGMITFCLPY
jgi:hypothetical protein